MPVRTAWDGTEFPYDEGDAQGEADANAALNAYQAANQAAYDAWYAEQNPPAPPPPVETWSNKYEFELLFRDDERARFRRIEREAAALPVDLTTERHALVDAFAGFLSLFGKLREDRGVNRADPKTAQSLQLFTALEIIDPAEAAWRVPQILAGQAPTDEPPETPE